MTNQKKLIRKAKAILRIFERNRREMAKDAARQGRGR